MNIPDKIYLQLNDNENDSTWCSDRVPVKGKNDRAVHLEIADRLFVDYKFIDHKNRARFDCRRDNLRPSTRSENNRNMSKQKNTTSKFKGVYWDKRDKKYISKIYFNGRTKILGYFKNEIDAAKEYDIAAILNFKDFACTNKMLGLL